MPNPTPDCCFIPLIYSTLSATDPTAFIPPSPIPIPISPQSLYLMPPPATQSHQSGHGSHGIIPSHPHLPTVDLPNATFGYSKSSELSRSGHGAATEPPHSRHESHGIIPSHPHLPTLALPNATFGYSKSSELSRSRHRAATQPPRSCHGSHGIIPSPFPSPHSRST